MNVLCIVDQYHQSGAIEVDHTSKFIAPKKIFDGFFAIFWEETFITLSKIMQNLKIRACFMKHFMELDMKKFFGSQSCDI